MKLLYFKFNDPASIDDWKTRKELMKELSDFDYQNEAVGWLVGEDKVNYYIAAHKAWGKFSASLKIPKGIVIKKTVIKIST